MKELRLKIKRENYNLFKELGDKQAGELIKGMCAYMYDGKPFFTKDPYLKGAFMGIKKEIDEAKQNSLNGKEFNTGLLADTPEYLGSYEAEGIKKLRR